MSVVVASDGDEEVREGLLSGAERRHRQGRLMLLGLGSLLIITALLSLGVGAVSSSPGEVIGTLLSLMGLAESDELLKTILFSIRLPRVLFAALVGALLGVAGAALQGIFRNPLADPALIGVSSGAALGVGLCIVAGIGSLLAGLAIPIAGFVGGLLATALVYRLATHHGRTDVATMLLAGIAINAFSGAGLGLLIYLSDDAQMRDLTMWTLGGLGGASWRALAMATPAVLIALGGLLRLREPLNAMLLGEAEAFHLGVDADRVKKQVVFFAALAIGATVGFSGMIGFVGLVVPHLLRLSGGADHRFILPGSALLGAALLIGADTLARTVAAPAEVPIGVLTALVGAPFFIFLLLRHRMGGVR